MREKDRLGLFAAVAGVWKGQMAGDGREEGALEACMARESGGRGWEDVRRLLLLWRARLAVLLLLPVLE